jgi:hypothetical protein
MKRSQFFLAGFAFLALLCLNANSSEGATIIVPDSYPTIQQAINAAVDGDSVYVRAGTYQENVQVLGFSSLKIIAEGADQNTKRVIIRPDPDPGAFYVLSDGVTIEGFEIIPDAVEGTGISFEGSYNIFKKNYIHHGAFGICSRAGMQTQGATNYNLIADNVIEDMSNGGISVSISWVEGAEGILSGNSVVQNVVRRIRNAGIDLTNVEHSIINGNVIEESGGGIVLSNAQTGFATNRNTIVQNRIRSVTCTEWGTMGILVQASKGSVDENTIVQNRIEDVVGCGWWGAGIMILVLPEASSSDHNVVAQNWISGVTGSQQWNAGILVVRWGESTSSDKNNIHHNDIRLISSTGSSDHDYGIWIWDGNYNSVHHNSVDTASVDYPYMDTGIGNKAFKNSW